MRAPVSGLIAVGALVGAICASGCGDDAAGSSSLTITIESADNIVSEDGVFELESGRLRIVSVELLGSDDTVQLLGPTDLDLSLEAQRVTVPAEVMPGTYTGLRVELAPPAGEALMLDAQLRAIADGVSVRATSPLSIAGETTFPEGPRAVTAQSTVELHLLLRGMFFYLRPRSDAVDGVYVAGENERDFLTMDLVGMFDLRLGTRSPLENTTIPNPSDPHREN